MRGKGSAPKTSARTAVLVPQPHGGALRRGNPGNHGRPRSEVRAAALEGAAKAVPRLVEIITNPESDPKDVIGASRVLCEFGLGRQLEIEDVTPTEQQTGEQRVQWLLEVLPRLLRVLPLDQQRAATMLQALKAREAEYEIVDGD